jgi:hypothetical protein
MASRERLDEIAWGVIKAAKVHEGPPSGYAASGRPADFVELYDCAVRRNDFEHAWSEFLHEFFRYKSASFFAVPPPSKMSPGRKAILAGTAEYLSKEFNLPVPEWCYDAEYTLPELWDPMSDWNPEVDKHVEKRCSEAHEYFLKRNVIFASRNLITI